MWMIVPCNMYLHLKLHLKVSDKLIIKLVSPVQYLFFQFTVQYYTMVQYSALQISLFNWSSYLHRNKQKSSYDRKCHQEWNISLSGHRNWTLSDIPYREASNLENNLDNYILLGSRGEKISPKVYLHMTLKINLNYFF